MYGNDDYNATQATKNFTVNKAIVFFGITGATVYVGEDITVRVFFSSTGLSHGNVTINVNNKNYSAILGNNNFVSIPVDKIYVNGTYEVKAYYNNDPNFKPGYISDRNGVIVKKVSQYAMNVTATEALVDENSTITVSVPVDATGNVTLWVNGILVNKTAVSEGKAIFKVAKDREGLYNVTATLTDVRYANQTVGTKYRVFLHETPMSINVSDIKVGEVAKIVVSTPDVLVNNVIIEINGESYSNVTVNGNATFYIPNLAAGVKTVVATYAGDYKYYP